MADRSVAPFVCESDKSANSTGDQKRIAYADPPYPGSGAVGRAWVAWRSQLRLEVSA